MRERTIANIVADSLLHFDGDRYRMGDFVIMPNHFHCLVTFDSETAMKDQCTGWMRYTARQINRACHRQGHFWQSEPFDHLVRSLDQYEYLRRYIAMNGTKANLSPDAYLYRRFEE